MKLAARYVQDRALPDSAVDLLDETAAQKRVETEGMPAQVDNLLRRLESLKAQRLGIANDTERASLEQKAKIDAEIARIEPQVAAERSKIEAQRGARMAEAAITAVMPAMTGQLTACVMPRA